MNVQAGFNISPPVFLVFCIAIGAINLCCTLYNFQTIREVRAFKELLANVPPEQLPNSYDVADVQYGTDKDFRENHLERLERDVQEQTTERVRKCRKRKKCSKRCNKRTKRDLQGKKSKPPFLAAQYVGATNTHSSEYEHINFLRPSKWVTNDINPVHVDNVTETFTFKTSGIHLVYAQILYPKHSPMKIAEIVHLRNGSTMASFRCNTGVFIHNAAKRIDRPQTCTVIGLVSSEKGDAMRVRNENEFAKVDILTNSVYFGVIKLYAYRTHRTRRSTCEPAEEDVETS